MLLSGRVCARLQALTLHPSTHMHIRTTTLRVRGTQIKYRWLKRCLSDAFSAWKEHVEASKIARAEEEDEAQRQVHIKLCSSHAATCKDLEDVSVLLAEEQNKTSECKALSRAILLEIHTIKEGLACATTYVYVCVCVCVCFFVCVHVHKFGTLHNFGTSCTMLALSMCVCACERIISLHCCALYTGNM
jgi:hypothetical protein